MESGKLHFMSGKGELIYEGAFDDIDMAMQMHADKNMPKLRFLSAKAATAL